MGFIDKAKDKVGSENGASETAETEADASTEQGTIAGKRDNFSQQVETKNDTAQNAE